MTSENAQPANASGVNPSLTGAARSATGWTGAFTAAIVVSALALLATWVVGVEITGETALSLDALTLVTGIGSWFLLSAWMNSVRDALAAQGDEAPATWKVWGGWLIPVYALFGPFLVMRQLSARVDLGTVRARWWASFLFANLMMLQSSLYAGTVLAPIGRTAAAVSLSFSYMALRTIIKRTTASVDLPR